jgi:hypothetical protein
LNTYSHLVLAAQLEKQLNPHHPADYYWGAVVPDIRYLTGMPRRATHIPFDQIRGYFSIYPQLASFVSGYLVHCLLDDIDLNKVFSRKLAYRLVQPWIPSQFSPVLLEFYYLDQPPVQVSLSGGCNEILGELGVEPEQAAAFAAYLQPFLASPSFESAAVVLENLGLSGDRRIEKYMGVAKTIQKNRLLKQLLFKGINFPELNDEFLKYVISAYSKGKVGV